MSIIEKMVFLGKAAKAVEEIASVDDTGVYMHSEDFTRIFGDQIDNMFNWGGEDGLKYCTKEVYKDGVKIYAIFHKDEPGYRVISKSEEVDFETAAAALTTLLGAAAFEVKNAEVG